MAAWNCIALRGMGVWRSWPPSQGDARGRVDQRRVVRSCVFDVEWFCGSCWFAKETFGAEHLWCLVCCVVEEGREDRALQFLLWWSLHTYATGF